jgi:CubicO group peptidase (beta-lactamase class C family)
VALTAVVLVAVGANPLQAQLRTAIADLSPARADQIDRIFAPLAGPNSPGYAVGVIQRGKLIYARGFGSANLDHRIPITPASVFNTASLAKQFTAAAIAILVRRGQISLEDPVRRFIPEMPAYPQPLLIKHLVYMTSGLREYYSVPRPSGRDWDRDHFTVAEAIAATLSQPSLAFRPGERWAYSNVSYMLLAEIVARVSGMRFSEFADREIFRPLGMTSTHVNDDLSRIVPRRVTGYNERQGGGYRQELRRSPHYGGSGLFTTVEDLARWDRSFETHVLGGTELTTLLLRTEKFEHAKANDAFGLVWGEYRGRRTLWYEGGDLGFSAYMVRLPDDRNTVIVLSNLGTGQAAAQGRKILDLLLPPG